MLKQTVKSITKNPRITSEMKMQRCTAKKLGKVLKKAKKSCF